MKTHRLTTAQAIIQFLLHQHVERDGKRQPFFSGCLGIFGHGCIAGMGQALLQYPKFRYIITKNEQASVHIAAAYAKMSNRLRTFACVSSIGPGATNMVTGAALATINRLPVLLLPGDIFAARLVAPVLQQLEDPRTPDISVNDCFRPVSRYWDRISRPEQLITSLPQAMRVLTSPAETGAVTLALTQDTQAEAFDYPAGLFEKRVWAIPRLRADVAAVRQAAQLIRESKTPIIVAGGGVHYSEAAEALARFAAQTGIAVGETQAGKAALLHDHPQSLVAGYHVSDEYRARVARSRDEWDAEVDRIYHLEHGPLVSQGEVIGAVNEIAGPRDVVLCASGSLPGDLHKLWRARDTKSYHLEYGYSTMGYEIAGGLGVKMAA